MLDVVVCRGLVTNCYTVICDCVGARGWMGSNSDPHSRVWVTYTKKGPGFGIIQVSTLSLEGLAERLLFAFDYSSSVIYSLAIRKPH